MFVACYRRIFEAEKKENEELVEQNLSMEKNILSMAREIEKLRAGQIGADRRVRAPGKYSVSLSYACIHTATISVYIQRFQIIDEIENASTSIRCWGLWNDEWES